MDSTPQPGSALLPTDLEDLRARQEKLARLRAEREERERLRAEDKAKREAARREKAELARKAREVLVRRRKNANRGVKMGAEVSEADLLAQLPPPEPEVDLGKIGDSIFPGHPIYERFQTWLNGRKAKKALVKEFVAILKAEKEAENGEARCRECGDPVLVGQVCYDHAKMGPDGQPMDPGEVRDGG